MLKSDYDMNSLVFIHYEAEICKRSSDAGGGESCIVENISVIVSYIYENIRNSWLWSFRSFIIVITRCVNDWILELL